MTASRRPARAFRPGAACSICRGRRPGELVDPGRAFGISHQSCFADRDRRAEASEIAMADQRPWAEVHA